MRAPKRNGELPVPSGATITCTLVSLCLGAIGSWVVAPLVGAQPALVPTQGAAAPWVDPNADMEDTSRVVLEDPRLELIEHSAVALPDEFPPSGLAPKGETGREIVVWGQDGAGLLLVTEDAVLGLPLAAGTSILAAAWSQEGIETLDGDRTVSMLIDRSSGAVLREHRIPLAHAWSAAVRVGPTWIVGGSHDDGRYHISRWEHTSAPSRLAVLPDGEKVRHLTGKAQEILVTEARRPFQVNRIAVEAGGRVSSLESPLDIGDVRDAVDEFWVSLPTVPLDQGYLQCLSDTRGDRRILVIYDREGRIIRTREIAVPIGFVASLPDRRLLFGARRIAGTEIVTYRWEWKAPD